MSTRNVLLNNPPYTSTNAITRTAHYVRVMFARQAFNPNQSKSSPEWLPYEDPAADSLPHVLDLPSIPLAFEGQALYFCSLLMCRLHPILPGFCKLEKNRLLGTLWPEDAIGSEADVAYFFWEFRLLLKVRPHLPMVCHGRTPFLHISATLISPDI